eukprot:SAG11_NODE_1723_length_4373_cov_8.121666_4_plen_43_part_00
MSRFVMRYRELVPVTDVSSVDTYFAMRRYPGYICFGSGLDLG